MHAQESRSLGPLSPRAHRIVACCVAHFAKLPGRDSAPGAPEFAAQGAPIHPVRAETGFVEHRSVAGSTMRRKVRTVAPESKGRSPFYPGQPVPAEFFVGRERQITHILKRGVGQVAAGKPVAIYVEGEFGIGKSSIAGFVQHVARQDSGLFPIYAPLGGAESIDDIGLAIVEATVRAGAYGETRKESVLEWLSKYVGEVSVMGVKVKTEALKRDAPELTSGLLPFLAELLERLRPDGTKGLFLVLDEVDSLAKKPRFAHFIKSLVDTNAMARTPVPLLLMLCGVEECRRELIKQHQPVDRIFDVVDIERMSDEEMRSFFFKAFNSVNISVDPMALTTMTEHAGGFPKIMHLVGDAAFWRDNDGVIDNSDALSAVISAAEDVGRKYVDQQVYRALRSKDYQSILKKLGRLGPLPVPFKRSEIAEGLTPTESRKLNNFLQKMKSLKVIRKGDVQGEYVFNVPMVRLYIWMNSIKETSAAVQAAEDVEPVELGADEESAE